MKYLPILLVLLLVGCGWDASEEAHTIAVTNCKDHGGVRRWDENWGDRGLYQVSALCNDKVRITWYKPR